MACFGTLAARVIEGNAVSREEALGLLRTPDAEVLPLLFAAYRIRHHHFGNEVRLNYLVNAKSGACSEDCAYCSQSKVSNAEIEMYPRLSEHEVAERIDRGVSLGATTCCIVMSGHHPKDADVTAVAAATTAAKERYPDLQICACLGEVDAEQAGRLKAAGVDRYNHNLNTSAGVYPDICSTHSHADRVATATTVRESELSLCSGLIVGMGETDEDLVDLAFELKDTGAHSLPVNFLVPIDGTTLAGRDTTLAGRDTGLAGRDGGLAGRDAGLTPRKCLKVLAMMRFVCPDLEIRVSAGRETHLRTLQPMSLYAANSLFVADYLTTAGQAPSLDFEMIEDLGFTRSSL